MSRELRMENWHYSVKDFDPDYVDETADVTDPNEYEEYKYNYLKDEEMIDFDWGEKEYAVYMDVHDISRISQLVHSLCDGFYPSI